jgi:hypothetical protein
VRSEISSVKAKLCVEGCVSFSSSSFKQLHQFTSGKMGVLKLFEEERFCHEWCFCIHASVLLCDIYSCSD